jgi:membrane protease YdiL (CAAX protease family)
VSTPELPRRPALPPQGQSAGLSPPGGGSGQAPYGADDAASWYPTGQVPIVPEGANGTAPPPTWPTPPPAPRATPPPPADPRRGWLMLAIFAFAEVTFLGTSVVVLLPFAFASPHAADGGPLPPMAMVAALIVPTVLAALVAVGGATLVGRGRSLWERLSGELALRWRASDAGLGLVLGAAGVILTLPASALWANWVGQDQANSAVGEVFDGQRLPLGVAIIVFFAVWLLAPLCEEVLYRGVLWRAMEYWGWNRWVIFTLTTVVFSFAHLELLRTPLLLVISLPIALARLLTGNLVASVVAHQANNFLPAVGLLLVTLGVLHP